MCSFVCSQKKYARAKPNGEPLLQEEKLHCLACQREKYCEATRLDIKSWTDRLLYVCTQPHSEELRARNVNSCFLVGAFTATHIHIFITLVSAPGSATSLSAFTSSLISGSSLYYEGKMTRLLKAKQGHS